MTNTLPDASGPALATAAGEVLRLLQRGDAAAASDALARMERAHGSHPRVSYLRGVLLMARDRDSEARPHLAGAASTLPDDAAVQANWSLCLQRLGEHDEALAVSDRVLALAPRHADAHYNRALILLALNRFPEAAMALRRTVELAPAHTGAWRRLGETEHALGRYLEAELAYGRAMSLLPADARLQVQCAALLYDAGNFDRALEAADRAVALDPAEPGAWRQRSAALRRLGKLEEAEQAVERALALDSDDADAIKARGLVRQMQDRLVLAADDFVESARRRFAPGPVDRLPRELRRISKAKLEHDIEQFAHLSRNGRLPQADALIDAYRDTGAMLPADLPKARVVDLPAAALRRLGDRYNRLHHLADAPREPGGALDASLDGAAIEADYFARGPGITWVDGLLSPAALSSLRRYCLESTFWFDFHHANGYLGAFFEDGFAGPLLLQIAEELRQRMPAIFRDYPLTQLWAFKYDSRLDGIELHADIAAVNLNFWITPDEANLDPASGGLVVWDKEAPPEWGFDEYNTSTDAGQARIERFLAESGAEAIHVPHRQNRAVLFNSDLFHRTDRIRFRDAYEDRRINITMLFGHRSGRTR